jgi:hypothetical protein
MGLAHMAYQLYAQLVMLRAAHIFVPVTDDIGVQARSISCIH